MRRFLSFLLVATMGFLGSRAQDRPGGISRRASDRSILAARLSPPQDTTQAVKCGLPSIAQALADRATLSATESDALARLMTRPTLQKSKATGNYRVHYDTSGTNTPAFLDPAGGYQRIPGTADAYADSVLAILSFVDPLLEQTLGYFPPPADGALGGDDRYDVYVLELGNQYGETTPDVGTPDGGRSTSYISIDNDFRFVTPIANKGLPALRVTLAHEWFHGSQIGRYGFWTSEIYFYEISSTWMEDVAYTNVNDYYNYLNASWGHFRNPETAFRSGSNLIMYSRSPWDIFLAKRFGTDIIRQCWSEIASAPPLTALDRVLRRVGSTMADAFAEWTVWNYYTAERTDAVRFYPEGAMYPRIIQQRYDFTSPERRIDAFLSPLAARYHQVFVPATGSGSSSTPADTVTLVLANIDVQAAIAAGADESYTYLLADYPKDPGYVKVGLNLYQKLTVTLPMDWYPAAIRRDSIVSGRIVAVAEGNAFPNPFFADGTNSIAVPISATSQVSGTLSVFSSSMDLVWSGDVRSSLVSGIETVSWNGRNSAGAVVRSGVYVYVLDLGTRTITGKIAVVRQ